MKKLNDMYILLNNMFKDELFYITYYVYDKTGLLILMTEKFTENLLGYYVDEINVDYYKIYYLIDVHLKGVL